MSFLYELKVNKQLINKLIQTKQSFEFEFCFDNKKNLNKQLQSEKEMNQITKEKKNENESCYNHKQTERTESVNLILRFIAII